MAKLSYEFYKNLVKKIGEFDKNDFYISFLKSKAEGMIEKEKDISKIRNLNYLLDVLKKAYIDAKSASQIAQRIHNTSPAIFYSFVLPLILKGYYSEIDLDVLYTSIEYDIALKQAVS